jgi:DNA helicase II / ATP-dependent DNA helicase PcrA
VFAASNYRGNAPLVHQIVEASNPAFERALDAVIRDLQAAASPLDSERLADVIAGAYARLGTHRGQQTWTEAARRTRAAMRLLAIGEPLAAVEDELDRARHRALHGDAGLRPHPVQVMNLHQTKGREAEATILLLQPDEYHGTEQSPYPKGARARIVTEPALLARANESKSSNDPVPPARPKAATKPAADGAWQSREQLSMLLVPIATRISFCSR